MNSRLCALLGALTADAASLGLHWLYDQQRLADIAARGPVVFLDPDPCNYEGARGTFAHGAKVSGDLSGYGEVVALVLRHLAERGGRFERAAYQAAYRAYFGPGGGYVGYADRPTRLTVARLGAIDKPEDYPARSGADDDQLPALACVPAIVAAMAEGEGANTERLLAVVEEATAVTSDNPMALDGARVCALALAGVIAGRPLGAALADAAGQAGPALAPLLAEALELPSLDARGAAEDFGLACHVEQGVPVLFHIAHRAASWRGAIEANILAGGDSCGRSIMLGALVAAARAPDPGIPVSWLARVRRMAELAQAAERLSVAGED